MTFFILIRHPQDEGNNNFSLRMSSFLLKKTEVKGFLGKVICFLSYFYFLLVCL
jgi:preprotein translocase subunit SecG